LTAKKYQPVQIDAEDRPADIARSQERALKVKEIIQTVESEAIGGERVKGILNQYSWFIDSTSHEIGVLQK
jgi:hypothetical protein